METKELFGKGSMTKEQVVQNLKEKVEYVQQNILSMPDDRYFLGYASAAKDAINLIEMIK